jgi:hypothetical protein
VKRKVAKPRFEPRSTDGPRSLLPMEIQVGNRLTDAGFEWEVVTIRRPCTAARACAQEYGARGLPETERDMTWPAHVRIKISRGAKPAAE